MEERVVLRTLQTRPIRALMYHVVLLTMEDFLEFEEFLELEDGEKLEDLDSSREVIMEDFLELEEWLQDMD
ncbi:hypothetical protein F2Q68_00025394 [Brassica cretica]|uniref:Uncharacterized protein n=2 Tax=Brassica cretica TaxID=69181 RepID=A0A8S9IEG4_BRACR|nr:hypothetical protein F2Q68_00025394 [Brassica cretica]KAF3582431.1 hypothetical protein DY000_02031236 [Brassica cretica]